MLAPSATKIGSTRRLSQSPLAIGELPIPSKALADRSLLSILPTLCSQPSQRCDVPRLQLRCAEEDVQNTFVVHSRHEKRGGWIRIDEESGVQIALFDDKHRDGLVASLHSVRDVQTFIRRLAEALDLEPHSTARDVLSKLSTTIDWVDFDDWLRTDAKDLLVHSADRHVQLQEPPEWAIQRPALRFYKAAS